MFRHIVREWEKELEAARAIMVKYDVFCEDAFEAWDKTDLNSAFGE